MIEADNFWHQKTFESILTDLQRMWNEGIHEQEDISMYCTENSKIDNEMDRVEVIDLCSESKTKNGEQHEGKESTKQESQDKMKTNAIARMKGKNRHEEGKPTTKNEENETVMMCWEVLKGSLKKEPHEESENEGEKPVKKTQKQKHEEEHVEPTLNKGNQLKISIEQFSSETESDGSTLDTQETEQQELVYIMNLKGG